MKQFSIFHIPVFSFFSKKLYNDVARNWKGICFGYLFLLLAICWLAVTIKMQFGLLHFFNDEAPEFISKIPTIEIVDGKASIDEPQPYIIEGNKADQDGKKFAVIDTTGKINTLEEADALMLLTQSELIYQKSKFETRTFQLKDVSKFTFDQELINDWISWIKWLLAPFVFVFMLIFAYAFRMIQSLVYAGVALLLGLMMKSQITFQQGIRISIVAVTPCILIDTVIDLFGLPFPFAWLVYFFITMGYLIFGVYSAKQEPEIPGELPNPSPDSL